MRLRATAALSVAALALAATGCASGDAGTADGETVTVQIAATVTPMTDAVEAAADVIEDGYEIELVPVSDYVQPNTLVHNREIDANLVQFEPFMQDYNDKNDADLVFIQPVYYVVAAFYSQSLDSLDELPEGGSVVIPNDRSNAARALELLASEGIIELDPDAEPFDATMRDIVDNPRNLDITQVDLMQLNTAYEEADAAFNLPSFARHIDLTPEDDGIAVESDDRFGLGLVAHADNADSEAIGAVQRALTSDHVRTTLEDLGVPPAF
ncbi:MetQ/NlpA family ABC transporter substrate-binding protein [uncultured Agrococcus sp.]|uniref:MetQ/NlpA family ABC transporter substrate-binding protein n=1 Tax=uncultured Agrococcus sp. TaxID=382258 RepID=UPI0025EA6DDA|nr:MetQ/NlpA family ABC transporter substrate-binding protein [uncultured Agrococcus sp.]